MTQKKMEQIKCYCGHTTYCDCGPLEEQPLKPLNQNKMGILRDKVNSLKKEPWYKRLRRWLKFKLWLLKSK
jgi:hypothetical protein